MIIYVFRGAVSFHVLTLTCLGVCRIFTMASNGCGWDLNDDISSVDPDMYEIIKNEHQRQKRGLEMIASENFAGKAVLQALGSCLNNKYSEGQVGQR